MAEANAMGWGVRTLLLIAICVMAFSIRLFSVVKYESVIHEFDPYFNARVTEFLTKEGFYNLWDWFDEFTWYPLGRVIGGTVYPGLIYTAGGMYNILHFFNIPIHIREVCVFTAPIFSAFCALATYGLVKECRSPGAGLAAAALVAVVPSYISRSVAGSYDNEGVAIFALVNVFYTFIKTLNTGSLMWATWSILAYFYMVLSWGGYSFIINLLPLFCLACIVSGRLTPRLYVAFAPLVVVGTLLSASVPVVGFNAVMMSEHFGAFFAVAVLHVALLVQWIKGLLPPKQFERATRLVLVLGAALFALVLSVVIGSVIKSPTLGWTGRSMTLLDPTYASKFVPIIASVSEHQPTAWSSYITDLHLATLLAPLGILTCFRKLSDGALFLVMYGVTAVYFSGVMVRLMLVLAPAVCCLSGVAISDVLEVLTASIKDAVTQLTATAKATTSSYSDAVVVAGDDSTTTTTTGSEATTPPPSARKASKKRLGPSSSRANDGLARLVSAATGAKGKLFALPPGPALAGIVLLGGLLVSYMVHCIYVSADMYSAPSIVLQSHRGDGSFHVFDDFREAYAWLRHNTAPDAKVASWWDYGYQTTAMANRTVIVDNNTWNTTHIATVGRAMSSPEYKAWKIYRSLDVEYVFVVFGGLVGYPSDDINKFLWMVRIGGGVYPEIKEPEYLNSNGEYRVDGGGSATMLKSLMYKLSYYDFPEASERMFGQRGFDRVRNAVIGKLDVSLKYFEEVFTSQHWMMRIYRVRPQPQREKGSGRGRKGRKS